MSSGAIENAYDASKATGTLKPPASSTRLTSDPKILPSIMKDGDTGHGVGVDSGRGNWRKGFQAVQGKNVENTTNGASTRGSPHRGLPGMTSGRDGEESVEKVNEGEENQDEETSPSPAIALTPVADRFIDDLAGYDALGHVPNLEAFRSVLSILKQRAAGESEDDASPRGESRQSEPRSHLHQGGVQRNDTSIVVEDLSKRDEVFRHFKRSYERVNRSRGGRASDPLFPTGLLQPDLKVLEAVGRQMAKARGRRNRVGEGILSTPVVSAGGSKVGRGIRQRCFGRNSNASSPNGGDKVRVVQKGSGGDCGPLTNMFWAPAPVNEDVASEVSQDSSKALPKRAKSEGELAISGDTRGMNGDGKDSSGSVSSSGLRSGPRSVDDSVEKKRSTNSTVVSSTSTELQVTERKENLACVVLFCRFPTSFPPYPSSEELVLMNDGYMFRALMSSTRGPVKATDSIETNM